MAEAKGPSGVCFIAGEDLTCQAGLAAHPDLYAKDGRKVRLAIHNGDLLTGSLTTPGFATSVHPVWSAMSPLAQPTARISLENAV